MIYRKLEDKEEYYVLTGLVGDGMRAAGVHAQAVAPLGRRSVDLLDAGDLPDWWECALAFSALPREWQEDVAGRIAADCMEYDGQSREDLRLDMQGAEVLMADPETYVIIPRED